MKTSGNICENCGMPMYHLSDFGTNRNKTINTEFCRHCYQKGRFVNHGISLEQKIEKNVTKVKKMVIPKEEATILVQGKLPTLKRYKGLKPVE